MTGKIIAVDLGGTNLRVALLKEHKIIKYIKKPTPKEKDALLQELVGSISSLMTWDVAGIGIGSPGPLEKGIIKNPPNITLKYFNLKKFLERKFHRPVEIENDAKCVALAESKLGCRKKDFFVLTLGTGIGGGIIINHELYNGRGFAGELGHIVLDRGRYFENLAAWKRIKYLTHAYFNKEMKIIELMKIKTPDSKEILEEITKYLGQGIASLINVFDPEVVVLSGGMKEAGRKFLRMIKKQAKKYIIFPRKTKITWTKLEHPGILGASLLLGGR